MNPRRRRRLRQLRALHSDTVCREAEGWLRIYEAQGYPLPQAREIVRNALDWLAHFPSARGAAIFLERNAKVLARGLSEGNVGKHPHLVSAPPQTRSLVGTQSRFSASGPVPARCFSEVAVALGAR